MWITLSDKKSTSINTNHVSMVRRRVKYNQYYHTLVVNSRKWWEVLLRRPDNSKYEETDDDPHIGISFCVEGCWEQFTYSTLVDAELDLRAILAACDAGIMEPTKQNRIEH